jgi:hypothetical protein
VLTWARIGHEQALRANLTGRIDGLRLTPVPSVPRQAGSSAGSALALLDRVRLLPYQGILARDCAFESRL